ncbi:MAG TPA: hypothetical protein VJ717_03520 [Gemmatimonadaceae bacterium]|nr:hypothetical protein [Gemmatimonadaceae bacterium]
MTAFLLVFTREILPALQSASGKVAWYTDPIVIGMAILSLFVVIDIAIMIARSGHRGRPQIQG